MDLKDWPYNYLDRYLAVDDLMETLVVAKSEALKMSS